MKIKMKKSINEIILNEVRRTWAVNPAQRVINSKKNYTRKDKSWKVID